MGNMGAGCQRGTHQERLVQSPPLQEDYRRHAADLEAQHTVADDAPLFLAGVGVQHEPQAQRHGQELSRTGHELCPLLDLLTECDRRRTRG
eukprot:scaffold885_cov381-Prasinococcus_capsulatus_cf.AAC.3